jgi:hypothetical protein
MTDQPKPTQPMPQPMPEWQRDMVRAVGDDLVRDLVKDFFRGPPQRSDPRAPQPMAKPQGEPMLTPSQAMSQGSGWVEPAPLTSPPGVKLCDQLVDVQDVIDRAERKRLLSGVAERVEQLAKYGLKGGGRW